MYCGDDVSSCVLDIGHYETRAGYSGEDQPRSVMPSIVGTYDHTVTMPVNQQEDVEMAGEDGPVMINTGEAPKTKLEKRIICGSSALNFKRDNMQIEPLYQQDGMINFDFLE